MKIDLATDSTSLHLQLVYLNTSTEWRPPYFVGQWLTKEAFQV